MAADAKPSRHPPATTPRPADIRLLIVGVVSFLLTLVANPGLRQAAPGLLVYAITILLSTGFLASVIAVPAYLMRGRRGDWRGFTVWCGKGLLILTSLAIVGQVRRGMQDAPPSLVDSLRTGRLTITRFLRSERAAAPALFDHRLLTSYERGLKSSIPTLSDIALVEVTESKDWVRAHMTYRARSSSETDSEPVDGHMVIYYHPAGTAVLGAVCWPQSSDCQPLASLLGAAEQSLRARLGSSDLGGVLPQAAECSTETAASRNGDHESDVHVCVYDSGVQLSLSRLGAAATIESLVAERVGQR